MKKRGQFYLVAGLIIISVIIGLIAMVNYTKKSPTFLINDFSKELKIETQKVLENEAVMGGNPMHQYGIDYSSHIGGYVELYFIKGIDPNIEAYKYVNGIETIVTENLTVDEGGNNKIILDLSGVDYDFDLKGGMNFYYLISQEIKGEYFVETG